MSKITVYRSSPYAIQKKIHSETHISFEELKSWIRSGEIFKHLFRYKDAVLITYDLKLVSKPFISSLLIWSLARGKTIQKDAKGNVEKINLALLILFFFKVVKNFFRKKPFLTQLESEISKLSLSLEKRRPPSLQIKNQPIYLRTDFLFGLQAGGSVGHIAGVLNHLHHFSGKPIFITSDFLPTINPNLEMHLVEPGESYWDFSEMPPLDYNRIFFERAKQCIGSRKPSFIYQRYSINHFSGVKLAQELQVPFVLEFNGSEVWVARNWGTPLKYEALAEKIECLNLKAADLIVVVSKPLKEDLILKGIDPEKILVNPNGVDLEKYHPDIDPSPIKERFEMQDSVVIGFIGTFGLWHGTEVLAEAFCRLIHQFPQYRGKVKLLMIGDGARMPFVQKTLQKWQASEECILTGSIPQDQGPQHLAACDILVSPQVPNADGTPFFGSPTKLFEYMAMGKGIVASKLDQIGEVLKHNHSAILTEPGNVESLIKGIKVLIDNPDLRKRLAENARNEVALHYSWKEHTRKIIEKLIFDDP